MNLLTSWLASPPPDAAVEITPTRVSAATVVPNGSAGAGLAVRSHAIEPLPPGAVIASLGSHNIIDRPTVTAAVRAVLDRLNTRIARVALIIPDLAVKVSLVRFDQVPARRDDLDRLVRWQVRKSAPFAIDEACVSHTPGARGADGSAEFVVVLARRSVVEEYERVCADAGAYAGLTHDWYIDERVEAEKATRAAAKYLKTLNTMFKGDWPLTLAAYNAGPGRVRRAMKRSGRADYWTLTASSRSLPRETRDYVPRVMAAILIGRNPVHYGMNVQPIDAPRFETVMLSAAVDLRWIAEWVGTTVKAIQNLNPELRRWLTPIRAAYYHLKVPRGTGEIVRAHLARADPDALAPLDWHTVEKGDTLVAVARKLKVSRIDLAEANYLSTRARLQSGQRLIVPRAPTLLFARRPDGPRPARELPTVDAVLAANTTAVVAEPAPPASLVHRVKRGDTLFSLARLYRTTVASLKNWNRLRSNTIRVGQHLTIFAGHATTATN